MLGPCETASRDNPLANAAIRFCFVFLHRGFLLTSGVLQAHYELVLLKDQSSSNISWISTTCAFLVLSAGIVTGPLYDRGLYRLLLLAGSVLQVLGLMMLSISTRYYQLFLSHGICIGIGAGVAFTPSVSAAARSLPHPATRAKAMGLMASGSCIGTSRSRDIHMYMCIYIFFPLLPQTY
jgi:MFS family permease